MFENVFETVNSGLAQALYEDYLEDPASVPEEWRELFDNGLMGIGEVAEVAEDTQPQAPAPAAPPASSAPSPEPIEGPALRLLQNMEASLSIPTATSFRDVDVGRLWQNRAALNRELDPQDLKLSFTHLIGWAIVRAMQSHPVMGYAVVEQDGEPHRVDRGAVNLGLAVDTTAKDGSRRLLVPVLKQADQMTFRQFYDEYDRLVAGAGVAVAVGHRHHDLHRRVGKRDVLVVAAAGGRVIE